MRPLRLSVAALLAMATAGGSAAVAKAAQVTPITFIGVSASPSVISYGNNTVTVTGQLVEYQDHTVVIAGEQVSLEFDSNGVVLDTVTTDAKGDFAATATLSEGATLRLIADSDPTYGVAESGSLTFIARPETPTVTLNRQPTYRVWAGTPLTFTGEATVSVNSVSQPLADAFVALYCDDSRLEDSSTTGADGTFTLSAQAECDGGQWTAEVQSTSYQSLYSDATSNTDAVYTQYETRVVNVAYPSTAEAHTPQKLTGVVQEYNGHTWVSGDALSVGIYYRTSSTGAWIFEGGATQSNFSGAFTAYTVMRPGEKQVQARALKEAYGSVWLPSNGPIKTIKVYDHTFFESGTQSVNHFYGRTDLGSAVVDWWPSGRWDRSFETVTGSAKVYYRPNTAAAWRYLGSAKLGQGGFVDYTYYGTLDGYFYIEYPAQGYFLASKSVTLHIS